MTADILDDLLAACDRFADAAAVTFGRTTLSYRQLRARILGVSSSLTVRGLVPGDRVLFSVRPGLDGICLALGIVAAGGTVVFADPGAGAAMFRARAALAAPRWVAAESLLYFASSGPLRPIARRRGLELPAYSSVVPGATHIYSGPWLPGVPRGAVPLRSLLGDSRARSGLAHAAWRARETAASARTACGRRHPRIESANPAREALIIFTSGTTDHPKAVVHSRASLGTGFADFAGRVKLAAGDRVLTDQLMVGIPSLIAGAHWTLPPFGANPGARPEQYLDLLPGADVLFAVPGALDSLLRLLDAKPEKTPALKKLLIGGAPVLRPLLERVRERLPESEIIAIYGMTEILPVAMADGGAKLAFTGEGDFVGELMAAVTARIVDGELVLSGPGLASGYLGEPPLAELRTGDLARLDGDRLVLSGRSKDMFIRGTTNVYPGLYEPVIAGLPGVAEVALVGVPDAIGDDRLVLALVPSTAGDESVAASVRAALPGLIDAAVLPDAVLTLDALPKTGRSGKLDRPALARLVAGMLP